MPALLGLFVLASFPRASKFLRRFERCLVGLFAGEVFLRAFLLTARVEASIAVGALLAAPAIALPVLVPLSVVVGGTRVFPVIVVPSRHY